MKYILLSVVVLLAAGAYWVMDDEVYIEEQVPLVSDHKNTSYIIDGVSVLLIDGEGETPAADGSDYETVTRYFGNELKTDLDGDGREDIVFLVTQETGGSGTFYYAVAALNSESGYKGSDGYYLGDRIAPQTINLSSNSRHQYVVVVNYADRLPDEPMTARPSYGRSAYLKLDPESMMWGIVEPDFEGESR